MTLPPTRPAPTGTKQGTLLERAIALVASLPEATVLGIGDLILDQYRRGQAIGLSPEAPAVELLNPGLVETPGGAANVAWNVGHLGGAVRMVGITGNDAEAGSLRALLAETPGVSLLFVEDPSRPTTLKLRFYHKQFQLLRVNQELRDGIRPEVAAQCREIILRNVSGCGAVFVEDYGKGLVTPALVETLQELRRSHPALPVVFDPKVGNHHVYRAGMCTLMKPNWQEACQLVDADPDRAQRSDVIRALSKKYDCDVLITLGGEGVVLFERTAETETLVPTRPREAFDIAGAGDTTLAVITLVLAVGGSLLEAAVLANLAGGIVVEKSGTAYVTPDELVAELRHPKTKAILEHLEAKFRVVVTD